MSLQWYRLRRHLQAAMTALLVVVPLVLLGGFAWMTNDPDAEVFGRLAELRFVGEPIGRLRDQYRTREVVPLGPAAKTEDDLPEDRLESVFIGGGAVLRESPSSDARELGRTSKISNLWALERLGDWVQVEWPKPGDTAWVDLGAKRQQRPPLGSAPAALGPLPGYPADQGWLELAEDIFGPDVKRGRMGPYDLLHDVTSEALLERLSATARELEERYIQRYGVIPIDQPRETIVLFRTENAYAAFRDSFERLEGVPSSGHSFRGMVALHTANPDPRLVEQTLIHELTHQLNRRAIGPALPAWLNEGLCEEFSESGFMVEGGQDERQWVRSFRVTFGSRYRLTGAYSSLEGIVEASLLGKLPSGQELVALDWRQFVGSHAEQSSGSLNYAASGWLMRYLVSGDDGRFRQGFRRYLAEVAGGAPPSGKRMVDTLGINWPELDAGFRSWILSYAREMAVPALSQG